MRCLNCSQFKSPTDYFYAGLSVIAAAWLPVIAVELPGTERLDQGRVGVGQRKRHEVLREVGLEYLRIHWIRLHRWFLFRCLERVKLIDIIQVVF